MSNRLCKSASTNEAVVVRLYWPLVNVSQGQTQQLPATPSALASQWQAFITWCEGQGIYNFVVPNELDQEYNGANGASPALWNPTNPSYMASLTDAIRA